jgi:hypothetical protein
MDSFTPQFNTTVDMRGKQVSMVSQGSDNSIFPEFYMRQVYMEFQSQEEGRPIYKDVPHLKIIFPADRTKVYDSAVKMEDDSYGPSDPHRFPRQWEAFLAQAEQVPDGTPIEQWPPLTRARVMELKAMHIHTVEQLAQLPDQTAQNIGLGWRQERELAQKWLEQATGGAAVTKLMAENERLKGDVDMLKDQVQKLARGESIEQEKPAARRGRPPQAA